MIATILLTTALAASPHVGVMESYLHAPDKKVLISGAFIGPYTSNEACLESIALAAAEFDVSANKRAEGTGAYVRTKTYCTQDVGPLSVFVVVAFDPGKFYYSLPYIALENRNGLKTGLIFALGVDRATCEQVAANTKADNYDVVSAACHMPNKNLPPLDKVN